MRKISVNKTLLCLIISVGACWGQDLVLQSPTTLTSGSTLYQASDSIVNNASFVVQGSASVTFKAGVYIHLEPGFHATASSGSATFHALIDPSAQSGPTGITSQAPSASNPSKEYIYMGGRVVAVENH